MGITRRTIISNYTPILTLQGQTHSRNYQFDNFQSQLNKKQGQKNLDMATNSNKMKLIPFKQALVIIGVSFVCCSILGANGDGGCENTNIYEDPNASWWESGLYVIVDKNGNGCDEGYFSFATDLCGKFDTVDFKAKAMCCVCGGGETE